MANKRLVLGTRGSPLDLRQAIFFKCALLSKNSNIEIAIETIKTTGDEKIEQRFHEIGTKGIFTKELDDALLDKQIDFAVHSLKDLPSSLADGLVLSCVPEKEDCRDAWISASGIAFDNVPRGAVIGTSSIRRKTLLMHCKKDFLIQECRGNVGTRIEKLKSQGLDGLILACAGLKRLGLENYITEPLDAKRFIPSVGQGMLGIVSRGGDEENIGILSLINEPQSHKIAHAVRLFMAMMEGGCSVPLGCYPEQNGNDVTFYGYLADSEKEIRCKVTGSIHNCEKLIENLYDKMRSEGAQDIIDALDR